MRMTMVSMLEFTKGESCTHTQACIGGEGLSIYIDTTQNKSNGNGHIANGIPDVDDDSV